MIKCKKSILIYIKRYICMSYQRQSVFKFDLINIQDKYIRNNILVYM